MDRFKIEKYIKSNVNCSKLQTSLDIKIKNLESQKKQAIEEFDKEVVKELINNNLLVANKTIVVIEDVFGFTLHCLFKKAVGNILVVNNPRNNKNTKVAFKRCFNLINE